MDPLLQAIVEHFDSEPLPYFEWTERQAVAERVLAGEPLTEAERLFIAAALVDRSKWNIPELTNGEERRREIATWTKVAERYYGNATSAIKSAEVHFGVCERQAKKARAELAADKTDSILVEQLLNWLRDRPAP
jgi:hypothetical protein